MSEILRIRGGRPLNGDVWVSGSKNAAVALIPAALLADSPSTIDNIPDIDDVDCYRNILEHLGAKVRFEKGSMYIDPRGVNKNELHSEMVSRMRASYYLVPTLMGRTGRAVVPMPGGCNIGNRRIDQTVNGLTMLGAKVDISDGVTIRAEKTDMYGGNDVRLAMPSVGATINTMLAAVTAPGETHIYGAAKEPHIVDTANFLSSMGAKVKGAGTDVIRITGGVPLHGSNYTVIPDQIETGTLMIAAAATHGDVRIHGTIPLHMEALTVKLLEAGVDVRSHDDVIEVSSAGILRPIKLKTQYYPGFPTDLQQPMTALLSVGWGTSQVTETIFENRFVYLDELRRMGASIDLVSNATAVIQGVEKLRGTAVTATDLRAGAAMIVAALMADGVSDISGVQFIHRGYEHIDEKLRALGAEAEFVQI
ncbi:MAG: UDP-N-acetylglucosamine 1-carboxyvinyltransferase [Clostridia bacterium]|nr:UDP-N-acetylglucosamine 1-carboxyvinyltransferase [Clostridia bacterium]MBR5379388.1 UDP-N-acetylglucosamine 1-carboxyvinyltransferase [Clostridia bacterium]MBR5751252.1 UDP-N-acetylglucosamine 1-carboxyvinyltransferase [Clostridia bacterium]